jgi:hypothetical protein
MSRFARLFRSAATPTPARKARLGVEALDARLVPSVTFNENTSTHSLTVTGVGSQNHTVTIRNDGDGNLTITADGQTRTFPHITSLLVVGGAGKDTVTYNQGSAGHEADTTRSFGLGVALKEGNDHFTANVFGDVGFRQNGVIQPRDLSFIVDGDFGADRIDFNLEDADVTSGSILEVIAGGSFGNDNMTLELDGEVDGKFLLRMFGDNDNDTIAVNVLLDADSGGLLEGGRSDIQNGAAVVQGDLGDDTLKFAVRHQAGSHAGVNAVVDGGFGFGLPDHDVGRHTANVRSAFLEQDIVIQ